MLLDRSEPFDSCQGTSNEAAFRVQTGKSGVFRRPIAGLSSLAVCSRDESGPTLRCGVMSPLSHALSQSHWQGDLGGEVDDTSKLLNDDDGRPKKGSLCNSRKTCVPLVCVLLLIPLQNKQFDCGCWAGAATSLATGSRMLEVCLSCAILCCVRRLSLCPSLLGCLFYQDKLRVPEWSARHCTALDPTCGCDNHLQTYYVEDFSIHHRSGRTVLQRCFGHGSPDLCSSRAAGPGADCCYSKVTSTIDETVTLLKERICFF